MYSVAKGEKKLYVFVSGGGDQVCATTDKKEALFWAYEDASYKIHDLRHKMPLKLTEEDETDFDVYVFEVTADNLIEIPFQDWMDEYYNLRRWEEKSEPYREYQRYLELKEKWEGEEPPEDPGPQP